MNAVEKSAEEADGKGEYFSYVGLDRRPMFWGVPYMVGLTVASLVGLATMACVFAFGPAGLLFGLVGVPPFVYVKAICANDDRAIEILLKEVKWVLIRLLFGSSSLHGGTTTFFPTSYGRRLKDVQRNFEEKSGR